MEEVSKAIELAMQKFKEEFGEDAKLEEGDEFVTVFNNCVLILGIEDRELKVKFVGGKPFQVDFALSIFGEED